MHKPARKHRVGSGRYADHPLLTRGIGSIASSADDIYTYIKDAAGSKTYAQSYFKAAKALEPVNALERIIEILYRLAKRE